MLVPIKCINENDDVTDNTDLTQFIIATTNAQSAEDIEDIFDIDSFLFEMAYEYLAGSWDHFLIYSHNYYLYRQPNGKWLYLVTDFDGDIGQDVSMGVATGISRSDVHLVPPQKAAFENYSFDEWAQFPRHLVDILINKDSTRFDNILKSMVTEAFNPATLFPHIDKLKEFIRSHVEADKTLNDDGKYPGKFHEEAGNYNLEQWDANCEFTTISSLQGSRGYGLKYWILAKYRYVCTHYNMQCDPVYMNENYEYIVNKNVEATIIDDEWIDWNSPPELIIPTPTPIPHPIHYNCMAESIGQPCCSPLNRIVVRHDKYGDWGYDILKRQYCGISPFILPYIPPPPPKPKCWTQPFGYSCCNDCTVIIETLSGRWGYDIKKNEWCGIPCSCH